MTTAQRLRHVAATARICLPFVPGKPTKNLLGNMLFAMDQGAEELELMQAKLDALASREEQDNADRITIKLK